MRWGQHEKRNELPRAIETHIKAVNAHDSEKFWSPGDTGGPKGYIDYPEFRRS